MKSKAVDIGNGNSVRCLIEESNSIRIGKNSYSISTKGKLTEVTKERRDIKKSFPYARRTDNIVYIPN